MNSAAGSRDNKLEVTHLEPDPQNYGQEVIAVVLSIVDGIGEGEDFLEQFNSTLAGAFRTEQMTTGAPYILVKDF